MTNEARQLIRLSAIAATGNQSRLRKLMRSPAFKVVPTRKAIEALLQLHLFAGFPATIEALSTFQIARKKRGFRSRSKSAQTAGKNVFHKVHGANADMVFRKLTSLDPDLSRWILKYGYGTVLSRPSLWLVERELCAVAVLASTVWKRQMLSHIKGAANVGATAGDIAQAVRIGKAEQVRKERPQS